MKPQFVINKLYELDTLDSDHQVFPNRIIRELRDVIDKITHPLIKKQIGSYIIHEFRTNLNLVRCFRMERTQTAFKMLDSVLQSKKFFVPYNAFRHMIDIILRGMYYVIPPFKHHPDEGKGFYEFEDKAIYDIVDSVWFRRHYDEATFDLPIEWQWKSTRGTFVKRLSSLLYKQFGKYELTDASKDRITKIIQSAKLKKSKYYFDFDRSYTWNPGDFQDGGSCFWESRTTAREIMRQDKRFFALRLFEREATKGSSKTTKKYYPSDEGFHYRGIARCWIAKERVKVDLSLPRLQGEHEIYILFNAYGRPLEELAYLFKTFLSKQNYITLPMKASNGGDTTGTLFINNGYCIMVGREDLLREISHYDFSALDKRYIDTDRYKPSGFIKFKKDCIKVKASAIIREAKLVLKNKIQKNRPKSESKVKTTAFTHYTDALFQGGELVENIRVRLQEIDPEGTNEELSPIREYMAIVGTPIRSDPTFIRGVR